MSKFKRLLCLVTASIMLLGCMSAALSVDANAAEIELAASQTQDRTAYFSKNYTLTGNYVDDYLEIARTQLGRRTEVMHYSEAWCANFVNDCARLTGMPDSIIPYNYSLRAGCRYLYSYMLENCNAKKITNTADLEPGDLVFYYCPETDFYLHVGIVETPRVFYIEGNYSDQVRLLNFEYNYKCYADSKPNNDFKSGHVKRLYLRPNYGCKATPKKVSYIPDDYAKPSSLLSYDPMEMTYYNGAGWVQACLYQLGFIDRISGAYDENTEKAVIRYQKSRGLEADGIVGNITMGSLEDDWNKIKNPVCKYLTTDKTRYNYFDKIELSTETKNADSVKLILNKNGIENAYDGSSFTFEAEKLGEGSYTAFFRMTNKYTTLDSNIVGFTVKFTAPKKPSLTVSDGNFYNAASFDWGDDEDAVSYTLTITNTTNGKTEEIKSFDETFFSKRLEEGIYSAYVSAENKIGAEKSNTCVFTVQGGEPTDLGNEFFAAVSAGASGVCEDGAAVAAGSANSLEAKWYFTKAENGAYAVKSCSNGKYLTLDGKAVALKEKTDDNTQRWFIGKNDGGYTLIPEADDSLVFVCEDRAAARASEGGSGEILKFKMLDNVHNYTITSYKVPDASHEGSVTYTCSITDTTYTKTLPREIGGDTSDTPDSPDKPAKKDFVIGDVNGDKTITSDDALNALRFAVGIIPLDALSEICADINFDLSVDSADAIAIQRYSVDAETAGCVGRTIVSD